MSRRRLALLLAVPMLVIVLLVGFTRDRATNEDPATPGSTTLPASVGEEAVRTAVLQPADETIDVPDGSDCAATTEDASPACQAVQVLDDEVAWLVEQDGDVPPEASFLRRESPTTWRRVLAANGDETSFDAVNVRLEDISGDGGVETIFAFHDGSDLRVDVVDARGVVVAHLDLGIGQALVEDGTITTFLPEGASWRRQQIQLVNGELEVVDSELEDGPATGNI